MCRFLIFTHISALSTIQVKSKHQSFWFLFMVGLLGPCTDHSYQLLDMWGYFSDDI